MNSTPSSTISCTRMPSIDGVRAIAPRIVEHACRAALLDLGRACGRRDARRRHRTCAECRATGSSAPPGRRSRPRSAPPRRGLRASASRVTGRPARAEDLLALGFGQHRRPIGADMSDARMPGRRPRRRLGGDARAGRPRSRPDGAPPRGRARDPRPSAAPCARA